jgi:hypothetical protein
MIARNKRWTSTTRFRLGLMRWWRVKGTGIINKVTHVSNLTHNASMNRFMS